MSDYPDGDHELRRCVGGSYASCQKAHVIVEYGKPIYPNELDKEQKKKIGAYCQDVIAEMLEKNKSMI